MQPGKLRLHLPLLSFSIILNEKLLPKKADVGIIEDCQHQLSGSYHSVITRAINKQVCNKGNKLFNYFHQLFSCKYCITPITSASPYPAFCASEYAPASASVSG